MPSEAVGSVGSEPRMSVRARARVYVFLCVLSKQGFSVKLMLHLQEEAWPNTFPVAEESEVFH